MNIEKSSSVITNNTVNTTNSGVTDNSNKTKKSSPLYKQLKLLGQGSFGKAFLVENTTDKVSFKKYIITKIILQSLAVIKTMILQNMSDKEQKEAFLEAKILEKLNHPNIIKFIEVFRSSKPTSTLNIVMDFAKGGDLQKLIKTQRQKKQYFKESQIIDWFTQICLAIKHIHDKKILHRDLKSQNIFLTENGLIKLGDFGIAKCLNFTMEKACTIVGTPYYLSPEIVQNQPYNFKSDIWSLGVLLYEMMALKMPFDAKSLPMLSLKIIKGQYDSIPKLFSDDLKNLVKTLLNTDPGKRPSINDVLSKLIFQIIFILILYIETPLIVKRIKSFLNEVEYNNEFSHTILHNYVSFFLL